MIVLDKFLHMIESVSDYLATSTSIVITGILIAIRLQLRKLVFKLIGKLSDEDLSPKAVAITQLLTELRLLTNSSRSYIYTFKKNTTANSDLRKLIIKCTHQSLQEGIAPIIAFDSENFNTTTSFLLQELYNSSIILMTSEIEDPYLKSLLLKQGIKISVISAIMWDEVNYYGMLCISYSNDDVDKKMLEDARKHLDSYALKLTFEFKRKY